MLSPETPKEGLCAFSHPALTLPEFTGGKGHHVTSKTLQNLRSSALDKVIFVYGFLSNLISSAIFMIGTNMEKNGIPLS